MKKVFICFLLLILISSSGACSPPGEKGSISKSWTGFISLPGERIKINIDFSGYEVIENGKRVLKASKLTISGDNYSRDVEFSSYDGEKKSNYWVFRTKSENPSYPYGIVSISRDYKSINGQIPDGKNMTTFYSEDSEQSTL